MAADISGNNLDVDDIVVLSVAENAGSTSFKLMSGVVKSISNKGNKCEVQLHLPQKVGPAKLGRIVSKQTRCVSKVDTSHW